jgi:outer membrane protein OmpA-like peptidoglycan-associated protein
MRIVGPCDKRWDELHGGGLVRYCEACGKEVHDLTHMSSEDALVYVLRRGGRLCARGTADGEGRLILADTRARAFPGALPILAATLSATMTACSGPPVASEANASAAQSCQTVVRPTLVTEPVALAVERAPGDSDGDGVPNESDACPAERGPANEDPARNGCPVRKVIVVETMGTLVILQQVHFARDSADIYEESLPVLRETARLLKSAAAIAQVSVEGHASSDEADAQTLSVARAQGALEWLVANGVDRRRLVARGWGVLHPVDANQTEEGRQRNRRVEFHVSEAAR